MEKDLAYKEKQRFGNMTDEQKEDLGLLLLMQKSDRSDTVSREDITYIISKF